MFEHTQKLFFRRRPLHSHVPSRSIRPKGIRCFATLVEDISCIATLAIGIPRRDSPKGHSLLCNISRRHSPYGHSLLRNILAMKLQMFPIFIKNYP